ncbi:sporulation histidine kinase inhibitor Sda [Radiobacillus sp. PE A8.2]|uniref:sporulation histidine kinase inhibitor Sda n=1 Tax=Radiobacillus sp. PE A8.2 TaxID=3380349 RepID=UPI00388FE52B
MKFINDELLVEVFVKAITLEYNKDVIDLLENEIIERKIDVYEVLEGNNIGY